MTRSMSSAVAALLRRMLRALNPAIGAREASPLDRPSATGPAWPSCALTAAPVSCTASVSLRSPGSASGRIHSCRRSVRPSGATAQ